jgi:formylglycine-generating enzyme required for sulfatase activity
MTRMQAWRWLPAAVLLAAGGTAGRAEESLFVRIVSPTNSRITQFGADGTLVWTNGAMGVTCTVQRAATLMGPSNWVDYAVCVATNPTMTASVKGSLYLVVDLSGGTNATSYPVTYLSTVPPGGWTDEHKTTKLVLRRIPATTPDFTMGGRSTDYPGASDAGLHQVTLTQDFYIGVFEVTQRQWELVMGNKPSYFNNPSYYQTRPVEQVSYFDIRENTNNSAISPNWPATNAVHADSFMGKLRGKTGLTGFDLPTESQWEYACRAGTDTALNSGYNLTNPGDNDPQMNVVGRYYYNGPDTYGYDQGVETNGGTAAAGSYLANAWGLYDMHGNVWEWCLDWYGTYPGTVENPVGAASGSTRVIRGGSWYYFANGCSSAYRNGLWPGYRYDRLGFRAALAPPGQP